MSSNSDILPLMLAPSNLLEDLEWADDWSPELVGVAIAGIML